MTTHGKRRRATPIMIGLVTALLVAAVALILGPLRHSSDPASDASSASPGTTAAEPLNPVEPVPPAATGVPRTAPPVPLAAPPSAPPTSAPARHGAPVALPLFVPGMPPYLPALLPSIPKPSAPKPVVPKPSTAPTSTPTPGLSGPAAQVVSLTNAQRVKAGCKPLKVDSRLNLSAQRHSADMARRNYFEHQDPEGHDFADREKAAGFVGSSGGENIAMGQTSAAEVMNDWMNSPGHRRNILDCSFTLIGVGYVADGYYWTQNFGG